MGDPDPVVAFLAVDGRADRLAAEHVDDGRGHCCTCPAGPQKGHVLWPCNLARLAAAARDTRMEDDTFSASFSPDTSGFSALPQEPEQETPRRMRDRSVPEVPSRPAGLYGPQPNVSAIEDAAPKPTATEPAAAPEPEAMTPPPAPPVVEEPPLAPPPTPPVSEPDPELVEDPGAPEVVDGLEGHDLVSRRPDPADRRAVCVVATEEGVRLGRLIEEARQQAADEFLQPLPEEDRAALTRILHTLLDDR